MTRTRARCSGAVADLHVRAPALVVRTTQTLAGLAVGLCLLHLPAENVARDDDGHYDDNPAADAEPCSDLVLNGPQHGR